MDLGAWLRGLGLERYEAAFGESADATDGLSTQPYQRSLCNRTDSPAR
jgi:hypothetical protein